MGTKAPVPPPGTEERKAWVNKCVSRVTFVGWLMVIVAIASWSWQAALLVAGLLTMAFSLVMAHVAGKADQPDEPRPTPGVRPTRPPPPMPPPPRRT